MLQFDTFPHPVQALRHVYPFAVNLRSALIALGEDTVIAPLVPRQQFPELPGRLSPIVSIDDTEYVVLIEKLTTVPVRSLSRRIANISAHRESILGAIDLLFFGV
jgi:toxin CcdB